MKTTLKQIEDNIKHSDKLIKKGRAYFEKLVTKHPSEFSTLIEYIKNNVGKEDNWSNSGFVPENLLNRIRAISPEIHDNIKNTYIKLAELDGELRRLEASRKSGIEFPVPTSESKLKELFLRLKNNFKALTSIISSFLGFQSGKDEFTKKNTDEASSDKRKHYIDGEKKLGEKTPDKEASNPHVSRPKFN